MLLLSVSKGKDKALQRSLHGETICVIPKAMPHLY